jgi:hypothetical protein
MAAPAGFISKTEKGSKFLFIGLLLIIIYQIITIGIAFSMQDDLEMLTSDPDMEDPEVTERIVRVAGAFCGAMIILLIGLILVLIGIIYLYTSRTEFGEEHAKNMQIGLIFLIVAFVVGLVGGILVGGIGGGANPSDIGALIIISGIIAIITSILYGLGFINILKKLLDEKGNNFVKLGAIFLILFSIINVSVLSIRYSMGEDLLSISNFNILGAAISTISLLPWAIFAFSFYRAWKRIQWGIVKPVFIPYPAYPQYPQYPGYPPPPGGMPPPPMPPMPPSGPPGKPNACPSCGYILPYQETTCPKCGYNLGDK